MVMYEMTDTQYQAVYDVLSFSLASMMATTVYLLFRASAVTDRYKEGPGSAATAFVQQPTHLRPGVNKG